MPELLKRLSYWGRVFGLCDDDIYLTSPRLHARVLSGHTGGISFHYRPCAMSFDRYSFCPGLW